MPGAFNRINALRQRIRKSGQDAFLATAVSNVRYLSGFTGTSGWLLVTKDKAYFITDSRYAIQAAQEVKGASIRISNFYPSELSKLATKLRLRTIGFEGNAITVSAFGRLKKEVRTAVFKPHTAEVEELRCVKDSLEVRLIRKAIKAAEAGFGSVEKGHNAGLTEREVALSIERAVKKAGADGHSFDTIVASGARSAMPHGTATDKKIRRGEFLIVDMGVTLNGYKSDETRTYVLGRPTKRQKKIYGIVNDAHALAIEAVRPGVELSKVDEAARAYIKKAGYGKCFGHGTGHGVGLDIHEAPSLSPKSKGRLKEGMIVTIEPGIYIPGYGGVRLEDMVLVTAKGCEILTEGEKKLRSIC